MNGTNITPAQEPVRRKLEVVLDEFVNVKAWQQILAKYENEMPEFFEVRENGHPRKLLRASRDIEATLRGIRNNAAWKSFRDQFDNVVRHMSNVKTMICLGLGSYYGTKTEQFTNRWVVQYAVFVYMWEKVDEKWRVECRSNGITESAVERYFQDPGFDRRTKYLLQEITRQEDPTTNKIIVVPEASDRISNDRNAFVFGPHLPCAIWPPILDLRPQVFIGNSPFALGGRPGATIETYMEETLITNNSDVGPQLRALVDSFDATDSYYRLQTPLNRGPVDPEHLGGLTIYQRSN